MAYRWSGPADRELPPRTTAASAPSTSGRSELKADSGGKVLAGCAGPASGSPAAKTGAQPMAAAAASLQSCLAKGGGSADEWDVDPTAAQSLHIVINEVLR